MFAVGTPSAAPEPLARNDASGDCIEASETARGGRDVALLERPADRRRRHDPSGVSEAVLDFGDDIDRKSEGAAPPRRGTPACRTGPCRNESPIRRRRRRRRAAPPGPSCTNSSALIAASAALNDRKTMPDRPSSAQRAAFISGGVKRKATGRSAKWSAGCGSNVRQGARRAPLLRQGDRRAESRPDGQDEGRRSFRSRRPLARAREADEPDPWRERSRRHSLAIPGSEAVPPKLGNCRPQRSSCRRPRLRVRRHAQNALAFQDDLSPTRHSHCSRTRRPFSVNSTTSTLTSITSPILTGPRKFRVWEM